MDKKTVVVLIMLVFLLGCMKDSNSECLKKYAVSACHEKGYNYSSVKYEVTFTDKYYYIKCFSDEREVFASKTLKFLKEERDDCG